MKLLNKLMDGDSILSYLLTGILGILMVLIVFAIGGLLLVYIIIPFLIVSWFILKWILGILGILLFLFLVGFVIKSG